MTTDPVQSGGMEVYSGEWKIDPANTTIEFQTKFMWVLPIKGSFGALSGEGTVGDDGSVTGSLTIDAASIDTGDRGRDDHLRSADFLAVETHPFFRFAVSRATLSGTERATLDGSLTVKGTTRPLQVPVRFSRAADGVNIQAEVSDLDRREWGLTSTTMGASVHNRLIVRAKFVRA